MDRQQLEAMALDLLADGRSAEVVAAVIEVYGPEIERKLRRLAPDLAPDAYATWKEAVVRYLGRYQGRASVRTYVHCFVTAAIREARRQARGGPGQRVSASRLDREAVRSRYSTELARRTEVKLAFRELVRSVLSPEELLLWDLRAYRDMTWDEIAGVFPEDVPVGDWAPYSAGEDYVDRLRSGELHRAAVTETALRTETLRALEGILDADRHAPTAVESAVGRAVGPAIEEAGGQSGDFPVALRAAVRGVLDRLYVVPMLERTLAAHGPEGPAPEARRRRRAALKKRFSRLRERLERLAAELADGARAG